MHQLSHALAAAGCIPDASHFARAVLKREALAGTACLPSTAIPHARMPELAQPWFALGRCREPLAWKGACEPVRWVLLLAVPDLETTRYLALLSLLSRLGPGVWLESQYQAGPEAASLFFALQQTVLLQRPPRAPASAIRS